MQPASSLTFFCHEAVSRCFSLWPARACLAAWLPSPSCPTVHWLVMLFFIFFPWALGFLNGSHLDGRHSYVYTLRALMSRCSSSLSVPHYGPCDLVLASLIMFSSLLCVDSLQTLVGAWWARASACLLADPTMSGRRNWSETGSTHRLCATYCCWTTLSRRSKSA